MHLFSTSRRATRARCLLTLPCRAAVAQHPHMVLVFPSCQTEITASWLTVTTAITACRLRGIVQDFLPHPTCSLTDNDIAPAVSGIEPLTLQNRTTLHIVIAPSYTPGVHGELVGTSGHRTPILSISRTDIKRMAGSTAYLIQTGVPILRRSIPGCHPLGLICMRRKQNGKAKRLGGRWEI